MPVYLEAPLIPLRITTLRVGPISKVASVHQLGVVPRRIGNLAQPFPWSCNAKLVFLGIFGLVRLCVSGLNAILLVPLNILPGFAECQVCSIVSEQKRYYLCHGSLSTNLRLPGSRRATDT